MPLAMLIGQLEKIGRMLNRWGAEIRLTAGLSILLSVLAGLALTDIMLGYGRTGRAVAWGILVVLAGILAERVARALTRRQTPESVAVSVERAFPQLDNHLINFLQFSAAPGGDPFKLAYVSMEVPHWGGLDFRAMKDRRTHQRARMALGVAGVVLFLPWPLVGPAWPVAVWRIANPFSAVAPVSLTHILEVTPGTTSIAQGQDIALSCRVEGKRGHDVLLDLKPADGLSKTVNLGPLKGGGAEAFSHTLTKVTTAVRYRFRAGDAFAPDWYTISLRPPLAFTSITLAVTPPGYMGFRPRHYDIHSASIEIPAGSSVSIQAQANAPLSGVSLSGAGDSVAMKGDAGRKNWETTLVVTNGSAFVLSAASGNDDRTEATLGFVLGPDRPPAIEIKFPKQPVVLAPGGAPLIEFTVTDDFGIDEITVEQVPDAGDKNAPAKVLKTYKWITTLNKEFSALWKGDVPPLSGKGPLTLRLVAKDSHPGVRNATVSAPLVFSKDDITVAAQKQGELEKKTIADLNRLIDLQRENIAKTKQYQGQLAAATAEQWDETALRQQTLRDEVKGILDKGGKCLGNLLGTVRKLHAGDMAEVIPVLKGVPSVKDESERAKQVVRALSLEEKILRQLTFAEAAAEQAKVESRNSALTGLLDGMIVRQDKIIKATVRCSTQTVAAASALTDDQDALGSDVAAFVKACQAEAAQVKGDDKDFAAFLEGVASFCETQKIREDMLLAAEQLEKKALDEALRHERSGYDKLLAARRKFDEMKATADKEMNQEMIEALQNATEKLEKLKALEKKLIAEMDAVEQNRDKSGKQTDKMEEDYKEIEKNIKEAMLQVPKDLDIFAHLNVGNDIVEDAYSVFEEVTQKEGSEKATDGPVKEKAYMKREMLLDGMEKVEKRLDDFESWLKNEPDGIKQTTESFDKEEMPEGVALTPLQTEMDDIIGDLMKTDKKKDEQDNDGAINSAMPDMEMGGPVTEGNMTTFSAKGRSGNETPDHKEQDGRSNVGRQGMANGETAAGSGTIGKGDDNIEARRTTDPTQAGQVNADGDAKTKATGGGKQGSGKGDGFGMGQGSTRMDSTEAGSMEGLMQMMAKRADSAYAKASMKGLRTDSLKTAAHHIRQAADAVSKGVPIGQVAELKRRAAAELRKAKTELGEGAGASLGGQGAGTTVHDVVESSPDEAPPKYRGLVSEYYKKLGDSL